MNLLFDGNYHLLGHTKELNHTPNDEKHIPKHENHHLNRAKHTWKDEKHLFDGLKINLQSILIKERITN